MNNLWPCAGEESSNSSHATNYEERKRLFLDRINSEIPAGVDWKEGARTYCRNVVAGLGQWARTSQLAKPFVSGPDFSTFFQHLYTFLNVIETVNLPAQAKVLDVACGGGWVSHFLAKLGHDVVGIDICDELLDVARERLGADPHGPVHGKPLSAAFVCHDIEAEPLAEQGVFDLAILESAMHHFFDPVAAFANLALSLKPDGVVAVIEGSAPPKGSDAYRHLIEVMTKYDTLERPYDREHVLELLDLTGFRYRRFFNSVNGLFEESAMVDGAVDGLIRCGPGWNLFIAGRTAESLEKVKLEFRPNGAEDSPVLFQQGFYAREIDQRGNEFRWSRPKSALRVRRHCTATFELESMAPRIYDREQNIYLYRDGRKDRTVVLKPKKTSETVVLPKISGQTRIEFYSDTCFCPLLSGSSDSRTLSFMLRVCPLTE